MIELQLRKKQVNLLSMDNLYKRSTLENQYGKYKNQEQKLLLL